MSFLIQLRDSIEARLSELGDEIAALEAARAVLQGDSSPPDAARGIGGAARGIVRATARSAGEPVEVLLAGRLEAILREAGDGLSASAISKRSNARYGQVLGLLRELEDGGQVRRTGTRRTSLWRLVTDEDRIAERTAELERLAGARSPVR